MRDSRICLFDVVSRQKPEEEQVTCSICLDTYSKPKTIACLHIVLSSAVSAWRNTSAKDKGNFVVPSVKQKLTSLKETFSIICLAVFCTTVCWVFSLFDKVAMEARSAAVFVRKRALRSAIALIVKIWCALTGMFQAAAAAFEAHKVTPVKQFQARDYEALLKRQSFCSQQYHETLLGVNSYKRQGLETTTWVLWIGDERQTTPAK